MVVHDARAAAPADTLDADLSALDRLELGPRPPSARWTRAWAAAWPKLAAAVLAIALWQAVVWTGWRPEYVLPGPRAVFSRFFADLGMGDFWWGVAVTLRRATVGFAVALVIGTAVGLAVVRLWLLRTAVGSLISGLQSMPSIAWFPLAILLFSLGEGAILFVVVLGAAPAIANGLIAGIDHVPPLLVRAGRVLGARGPSFYGRIVLPAALPSFVAGLKQGWAFAWRSLMAGELIVIVAHRPSIGARLQLAREFSDGEGLLSVMVTILLIGIAVDSLVFGTLDRSVRRRRGLGGVA